MESAMLVFRMMGRLRLITLTLTTVELLIFRNSRRHSVRLGRYGCSSLICSIALSPSTFQTVFFSSDIDRSGSIQLDQFIKVGFVGTIDV